MEFFNQAIDILKILVMALGAGLAVWGVINLLEGYGSDNPAAKSQGIKHLIPRACFITSNSLEDKQYGMKYGRIGARELGKARKKRALIGGGVDV